MYCIGNETFTSKNEIFLKCKKLSEIYFKKDLLDDDLNFMINIFKYHPDKKILVDMKRIFVDLDSSGKYKFFYVEYNKVKNKRKLIAHLPYRVCINHIPYNMDNQTDILIHFGKYKNESLTNIYKNDPQYIHWLLNLNLSKNIKTKINQLIRFGYIPK